MGLHVHTLVCKGQGMIRGAIFNTPLSWNFDKQVRWLSAYFPFLRVSYLQTFQRSLMLSHTTTFLSTHLVIGTWAINAFLYMKAILYFLHFYVYACNIMTIFKILPFKL